MGHRLTHLARERGLRGFENSLGINRASFSSTPQGEDGLGDWCLLTAQTWEERRPRQGSRQGSWDPGTTPAAAKQKPSPAELAGPFSSGILD